MNKVILLLYVLYHRFSKLLYYPYLINDFNINNYDAFHITSDTRRGNDVAIYTKKA